MFLCCFFSYFSDVTQRGHVRRYDFRHEKLIELITTVKIVESD
jgi:hypothetical protein